MAEGNIREDLAKQISYFENERDHKMNKKEELLREIHANSAEIALLDDFVVTLQQLRGDI